MTTRCNNSSSPTEDRQEILSIRRSLSKGNSLKLPQMELEEETVEPRDLSQKNRRGVIVRLMIEELSRICGRSANGWTTSQASSLKTYEGARVDIHWNQVISSKKTETQGSLPQSISKQTTTKKRLQNKMMNIRQKINETSWSVLKENK
ncbi:hypothetical protein C922_03992 [Plasmodium inui San Antonio 1]|uniref:Uncharacterized protein n=1 Tax=Plasmodium inui San Antonio 1 TaxID=1237626 RepID=W7A9C8_9APIC|nr:hypothetical protein C922_03992 [Plasmodium inui San Antonio 1]EUD65744.1 hypothetical protein C922_03992 [Plasmodium inui San Antonio 1]